MQKIAGSEGTIWSWSLTDRTNSLPIIEHCAKVIEMPIKFMQQINKYKRWFANGYSGAKEDVQFDLYTCVRAILDIEPKLWKKYLNEIINPDFEKLLVF